MTKNKTVIKAGLIAGFFAAFMMATPDLIAGSTGGNGGNGGGMGKGGGGNGGNNGGGMGKGGGGNGGNNGSGMGKGGGGNGGNNGGGGGNGGGGNGGGGNGGGGNGGSGNGGGNQADCNDGYRFGHSCSRRNFSNTGRRVVVHRSQVRRHRVVRQRVRTQQRRIQRQRRVTTNTTYTTSWAPGYSCTINGAPVYRSRTCKRAHRAALRGGRYAFADGSGYASYVSVATTRRVVRKQRRVTKRQVVRQRQRQRQRQRVIYVEQAPRHVVQPRVRYVRPRGRVVIQGSLNGGYNGYSYGGSGVNVHYGPLITKQSPY